MKILVVDDHALVRSGLCQVLRGLNPDEAVEVFEAADCKSAFDLAKSLPDLDLVLLDYHLPDMNGLAALAILGKKHPELPVVILSGSANPSIAQRVLSHGAAGFITKSGLSDDLLHALRLVLQGEVYVPPEFAAPQHSGPTPSKFTAPTLTKRQQDVLQLLIAGNSNREISDLLELSDETIKNHVSSILKGFAVKTRTQAVLEARRWGYDKSSPVAL